MSRLTINFPWIFNSLSGVQPSSELDDNYNAVPAGTVTIGPRVVAASEVLDADDEYSFFLCVPTSPMNLTPPGSMATNYSFFFSNQNTSTAVTLVGDYTIDGQAAHNPTFPGNYGTLTDVIGGMVVFDGSTLNVYPKLFLLS